MSDGNRDVVLLADHRMVVSDGQDCPSETTMRPSRTSYGYLAPRGAKVRGWLCPHDECGAEGDVAPTGWPTLCPDCGSQVDPIFEEPWAHAARFYELRHALAGADEYTRRYAEVELQVWAYEEAWRRDDGVAAANAWTEFRRIQQREGSNGFWISMGRYKLLVIAVRNGDVDQAFREMLRQYHSIGNGDVGDDATTRSSALDFVSGCIVVLESEVSVGHPQEATLDRAMRDVAHHIESDMTPDSWRGMRRAADIRAFHRSGSAIHAIRCSDTAVHDYLPSFSQGLEGNDPVPADVDSAVESLRVHDDPGPINMFVERSASTELMHMLDAHRHVAAGDLHEAVADLDAVLTTADASARRLRWQAYSTKGVLVACLDPANVDAAVELCRRGLGRRKWRPWRASTAADTALARLLLWRAQRSDKPVTASRRSADISEAVRLTRRRRRSRACGFEDLLVGQEARAASGGDPIRLHGAWSRLVSGPWSAAEKARAAAAWTEWALGTRDKALAAEAYHRLVALVAEDCADRYTVTAKQRVLAVAQEYAEEAGYWLARSGRYREAVLALETGRAVGLSEMLGRECDAVVERLRIAGRSDLSLAFSHAVQEYEDLSGRSASGLRQAWDRLRDVARDIKAVVGSDPLRSEIDYRGVTAETGEGALVYIAAAKAGGYALVVAARHDPQFIDLPRLDRASVSVLVDCMLPQAGASSPASHPVDDGSVTSSGTEALELRDAWLSRGVADPVMDSMRALWTGGVRDLLRMSARGRIVTFIPVGLLSLLPLHAAGDLMTPPDSELGTHSGHFSAIRYAPNVRALRRCRETIRGLAGQDTPLLAVDVPDGHGLLPLTRLNHVTLETEEATRFWSGGGVHRIHECTWNEFRLSADHHTVWHLACHASSNPLSIMETRLYFADQDVSLDELRRSLRWGRRRLAVLSACETNLTDTSIPNEFVGLSSALIQIGFAGVVAAAWKVDDLATAYLMAAFYRLWCTDGIEPVIALNRAQVWLRSATYADLKAVLPQVEPRGALGDHPYRHPRYWAAFAYNGA